MEGNSFAMPSCEEIVEDDSGSEYLELEIQSKSSMEKENRNNEKETRKKSKSRKSTGRRVRKIAKEEESQILRTICEAKEQLEQTSLVNAELLERAKTKLRQLGLSNQKIGSVLALEIQRLTKGVKVVPNKDKPVNYVQCRRTKQASKRRFHQHVLREL